MPPTQVAQISAVIVPITSSPAVELFKRYSL
jgi:hypothetical protein